MSDEQKKRGLSKGWIVVQELRNKFNFTQSELAARAGKGWDNARVSRLESGKIQLTPSTIDSLADAFEMRPERLYLLCLMEEYPNLKENKLGALLEEVINEFEEIESKMIFVESVSESAQQNHEQRRTDDSHGDQRVTR